MDFFNTDAAKQLVYYKIGIMNLHCHLPPILVNNLFFTKENASLKFNYEKGFENREDFDGNN